jgi:hypothetical protein
VIEHHLSGMKARNGTLVFVCATCKAPPNFTFGAQTNGELAYGAVGHYETPPNGFKDRARPREILVFGRRWKFIERILPEPEWP